MIDDEEWEPCVKDLRQSIKDAKDDEELEDEVVEEELEVKDEGNGFVSLK